MLKHIFSVILSLVLLAPLYGQNKPTDNRSPEEHYQTLKKELMTGWNTWDNRSVLTHVMLPDGLALILGLEDTEEKIYEQQFFTGNRVPDTDRVRTIAHTPDGSFTHLTLTWQHFDIRVRTASQGDNLYIVVSQDGWVKGNLHIKNEMLYDKKGQITVSDKQIKAKLPNKNITFFVNGQKAESDSSNALVFSLEKTVYISTQKLSDQEIKQKVDDAEKEWLKKCDAFGGLYSESGQVYSAIQNALNWLVVYDPQLDRLVTPVARTWAYGWGNGKPGGYVLFCWDNLFAAWMHSIESKELAYNEGIQMCNHIDELGFVPNYAGPGGIMSRDRSQPPVGGMCIKKIYERYPEKWFLEYNFDKLLRWNRWWDENRNNEGLLSWGSHPFKSKTGDRREQIQNLHKAATNESGLDNSPMYDGVEFDTKTHMLKIQDVGLTGLYLMDCDALAYMAKELGREKEYTEITERAQKYRKNMRELWDNDFGLYLNRHLESGKLSKRISPTNFYALNGQVATQSQAERMMKDHFYNPDEFWGDYIMPSCARNDTAYTGNTYWRGSIWAPMNLLVYWGMQNYYLPKAKHDMAEKSKTLLLKNWLEKGWIRENYDAEIGGYNNRSEHFYHWGALLGMVYLVENGYLE